MTSVMEVDEGSKRRVKVSASRVHIFLIRGKEKMWKRWKERSRVIQMGALSSSTIVDGQKKRPSFTMCSL